jgi:transposase
MRGRRFQVAWHEEDTAEALKVAYQGERDLELRRRLHGLWLLRSGWRLALVAAAVGVHYRSVQRWVGWYRQAGVPKVLSHKMGGKGQVPFLSEQAQEQVAQEVSTGGFRTAGEIRDWIAEQYGVTYTVGGVYSLMRRLQCAPKAPRPLHAKADQERQASWKKGGFDGRLWKPE